VQRNSFPGQTVRLYRQLLGILVVVMIVVVVIVAVVVVLAAVLVVVLAEVLVAVVEARQTAAIARNEQVEAIMRSGEQSTPSGDGIFEWNFIAACVHPFLFITIAFFASWICMKLIIESRFGGEEWGGGFV
jgi:hypothetical protein